MFNICYILFDISGLRRCCFADGCASMRNPCFERRMLLCLVFLFCFLGNLYVLHRRHAFVLNVCCSTAACLLFADLRVSLSVYLCAST